jgi:putative membrane protein
MKPCWFCTLLLVGGAGLALPATVGHNSNNKQPDRQFIRSVAIADMTEAHMAEMAQNSASASAVKDFGGTLDKEDLDEYGQLSALAGKAGTTIPKGIKASGNPSIQALTKRKGAQFDRSFLRSEIADEQKLISMLDAEAAHGSNADIKAWAARTSAARKQELDKAKALAK